MGLSECPKGFWPKLRAAGFVTPFFCRSLLPINDDLPFLELQNQKFFDLSNNWGEKADIMRYEILYQFGGVYGDIDFICFKPLDILCQYDVCASLETISCAHGAGVNNAIIGATPGHPLLKHCIDKLEKSWYSGTNVFERVGPRHFTKSFIAHAEKGTDNIIALPKSFFYPLDCHTKFMPEEGKAFRNALLNENNGAKVDIDQILEKLIKEETFAIHLWAGTWLR